MKKTKMLVMAAVVTLLATTSVYAKLPANTIIIGSDAFDVNYLFDNSHIDQINNKLNPSDKSTVPDIYFVDSNQNIKDIFNPTITKKESDLINSNNPITYYSNSYPSTGITYTYNSTNSEYSYFDKPVVKFNVTVNSFSTGYIVNIVYNNGFVDSSNTSNKLVDPSNLLISASKIQIKGIDSFNTSSNNTNKPITYFSSSKSIPISVLDGNTIPNTIAVGQIDLSNLRLGQPTDVTCTLFKSLVNTSLDTPSGNSQNSGEIVVDGTDIYYVNSSDRGTLYKHDSSTNQDKEISEDKAKYLCVKGDYIYYINLSDGGKLYAVKKTDMKDRKKISDYVVNYLTASDTSNDLLYFINGSDSNKIYSFDTTHISDTLPIPSTAINKVAEISAKTLNIVGNDIYYININNSNKLYKYSGSTSAEVSDVPDSLVQSIGKDSNKFISCTASGDVYNGTDKININLYNSYTKTSKPDKASKINVIGDYIYYKSINDGGKLYRVNVSGGNAEVVVPYAVDNIYVVDSQTLYYSQGGRLSRIDISMDNTGKTSFAVTQPQKELQRKILSVNNPNTVLRGNDNPLPAKLNVTFVDSTTGDVPVYWNLNKPIYNTPETIYSGVLLGGMTVQYHYSETSGAFSSDPINNTIINNPGNRYTLIISGGGLASGDTAMLYSVSTGGQALGQGVVGADGKAFINNLNITAGDLYISRTEKGKAENTTRKQIRGTAVSSTILSSPLIASVSDNDTFYNGADGRDLSIKVDDTSVSQFSSTGDKKYVYILPRGTTLDLNTSSGLKAYNLTDTNLWTTTDSKNYTGTSAITTDSLGRTLNTGIYDIYVIGEKSGDKYASNAKSVSLISEQPVAAINPVVTGDKFKAKGAISDVNVKLVAKTAAGTVVNDVTKNYTITVKKDGLTESDYAPDLISSNAINLKKDYVNTLPVGDNEFQAVLTDAAGKTITAKFVVTVNPASSFTTSVNVSRFTKGYAPSDVNIGITGTDKNGNAVTTSTTLNNLTVSVNNTPINNFTINNNVVKLNSDFLSTLPTGDTLVKIENEDLGLSETVTITVVDSQAELTPEITDFKNFKVGHADEVYPSGIPVKLNAKDLKGYNVTFSSIDNIEYEGTKIPNSLYSLSSDEVTLNLSKEFLNELHSGSNVMTITGNTNPSSGSTSSKISGVLNINVDSAAGLQLNLKDSGKDAFTKASSQDIHYDAVMYDNNNSIVDKSKVDLTNIKMLKGTSVLQKGVDFDIDNVNKVVTLRKSYLDKLIAGDTTINVNLNGSSTSILLKVDDGTPSATSNLTSFACKGSPSTGMAITVTGITANSSSDIKINIKPNNGSVTTIAQSDDNYTVASGVVTIKKGYLDTLSAASAPYTISISDAGETKTASVTLDVTSIAKFTPISYTINSVTNSFDPNNASITFTQSSAVDTSIKVGETDCDGNSLTSADLTDVTAQVSNQTLTLTPTTDYSISGDTIIVSGNFLKNLPKGTATLTITKDGIVTPAKVNFVVQ